MELELLTAADGRSVGGGSFLSLITFLQSSMKFERVEFNRILRNCLDERWIVYGGKADKDRDDEKCLRSRVEKFIVYGGQCPLQVPGDGWAAQEDWSWRWSPERET